MEERTCEILHEQPRYLLPQRPYRISHVSVVILKLPSLLPLLNRLRRIIELYQEARFRLLADAGLQTQAAVPRGRAVRLAIQRFERLPADFGLHKLRLCARLQASATLPSLASCGLLQSRAPWPWRCCPLACLVNRRRRWQQLTTAREEQHHACGPQNLTTRRAIRGRTTCVNVRFA